MTWIKQNWFKYFFVFAGFLILLFLFVNLSNSSPASLPAPDVKKVSEKTGATLIVEGKAYPEADLNFYLDNNYFDAAKANSEGNFSKVLDLNNQEEGEHTLTINQSFKEVRSQNSQEYKFELDLTPPVAGIQVNSFSINDSKSKVYVLATAQDAKFIHINNNKYEVKEDRTLEKELSLTEGINNFSFAASDEFGNKTEVLEARELRIDRTPPRIKTGLCSKGSLFEPKDLKSTEEFVCVDTGDWRGWGGTASVPIEGYVIGELSSITVDGKRIYYDENDDIFQRITLSTPYGLNKYKVVASDGDGNSSSALLEMSVVSVDENEQDEVLDRLDDIESRFDDLDY